LISAFNTVPVDTYAVSVSNMVSSGPHHGGPQPESHPIITDTEPLAIGAANLKVDAP
jgi:hypothetical protein